MGTCFAAPFYTLYTYAGTTYASALPVNLDFRCYDSDFVVFYHPFLGYI